MLSYTLLLIVLLSPSSYASSRSRNQKIIEDITKGLASLQISETNRLESFKYKINKEYTERLEKLHGVPVKAEDEGGLFLLDAQLARLFALPADDPASDPLCSCSILGSRLSHPEELFAGVREKGYKSILKCLLTIPLAEWKDQQLAHLLLAVTYKQYGCYDKILWMLRWLESHFEENIRSVLIAGNEELLRDLPSLSPHWESNINFELVTQFDECRQAITEHDVVDTVRYLHESLGMSLKFFKPYVNEFAKAGAVKILNYLSVAGMKDRVLSASTLHNVPEVALRLVKDGEVCEFALGSSRFNGNKCPYKTEVWKVTIELRKRLAQRTKNEVMGEGNGISDLKGLNQAILNSKEEDPLVLCQILENSNIDASKLSVLSRSSLEGGYNGILRSLQAYDLSEWDEKFESLLFLCKTYKSDWYDKTLWMALWFEADYKDIMGALYESGNVELMKDIHNLPRSSKFYIPPPHHLDTIRYLLEYSRMPVMLFKPYVGEFAKAGATKILTYLSIMGLYDEVVKAAIDHNVPEVILRLIKNDVGIPDATLKEAVQSNSINGCPYKNKVWEVINKLQIRLNEARDGPIEKGNEISDLKSLNGAILSSEKNNPLLLRQILENSTFDASKLSVLSRSSLEGKYNGILRSLQAYDLSEWDEKFDSLLFLCKTYKSGWYDEALWMALWFEADYEDIMGALYVSGNVKLMMDIHELPRSPKQYIPTHNDSILMNMELISQKDAVEAVNFALEHSLINMDNIIKNILLFYKNGSVQILRRLRMESTFRNEDAACIAEAVGRKDLDFILLAKNCGQHHTEITSECFSCAIHDNNARFIDYALERRYKLQKQDLIQCTLVETSPLSTLLQRAERSVVFEFIAELINLGRYDALKKVLDAGARNHITVAHLDQLAREGKTTALKVICNEGSKLLPSYEAMMEAIERGDEKVFSFIRRRVIREVNASSQVNPKLANKFSKAFKDGKLDIIYKAIRSGYGPTETELLSSLQTLELLPCKVLFRFFQVTTPLVQKVLLGQDQSVIDKLLELDFNIDTTILDKLAEAGKLDIIKQIYLKKGVAPSIEGYNLAIQNNEHLTATLIWLIIKEGSYDSPKGRPCLDNNPGTFFICHVGFFVREKWDHEALMWIYGLDERCAEEVRLSAVEFDRMEIIDKIVAGKNYKIGLSDFKNALDYRKNAMMGKLYHANKSAAIDFICGSGNHSIKVIQILIGEGVEFTEDQVLRTFYAKGGQVARHMRRAQ